MKNPAKSPDMIVAGSSAGVPPPGTDESEARMDSKKIGEVILDVQNISLRFGGVKALTDISFNVR